MGCSSTKSANINQRSGRSLTNSAIEPVNHHSQIDTILLRNNTRTATQPAGQQLARDNNAYQTRFGNRYQEAQAPRETTAARMIRPTNISQARYSEESSDEENNSNHQASSRNAIPLALLGQILARDDPVLGQLFMNLMAEGQTHERLNVYDPKATEKMSALKLPETGLMPFQIESIYAIEYKKGMIKSDDPSKHECNICLVPFEDKDMVKSLQCLHMYHQKCIDDWLSKKSICPNCKFNMRALDMDQLV